MRFPKRSLAAAAAVITLAGSLAGCATSTDGSPAVDSPNTTDTVSATARSEPATSAVATATPNVTTVSETAESTIDGVTAGSYTASFDGKQVTLKGAYLIDGKSVSVDGGTYSSVSADQAVFLVVNGGSLTIVNATIQKSGDASANSQQNPGDVSDDYNFYGLNSAIVVVGKGSSASVSGSTVTTTSSGSNAVVSTDSGKARVSKSTITTSGNSARGLHATYGGTITGKNLTITTSGAHSAALATDRGSGTVSVTGKNQFNTSGDGSPLLYSTGDISAAGVSGTAADSQVVVVEARTTPPSPTPR
ncbi:MAG: hypothetical protein ACOYEV_12590 [Candidatus Nanopelagicales bacterium]